VFVWNDWTGDSVLIVLLPPYFLVAEACYQVGLVHIFHHLVAESRLVFDPSISYAIFDVAERLLSQLSLLWSFHSYYSSIARNQVLPSESVPFFSLIAFQVALSAIGSAINTSYYQLFTSRLYRFLVFGTILMSSIYIGVAIYSNGVSVNEIANSQTLKSVESSPLSPYFRSPLARPGLCDKYLDRKGSASLNNDERLTMADYITMRNSCSQLQPPCVELSFVEDQLFVKPSVGELNLDHDFISKLLSIQDVLRESAGMTKSASFKALVLHPSTKSFDGLPDARYWLFSLPPQLKLPFLFPLIDLLQDEDIPHQTCQVDDDQRVSSSCRKLHDIVTLNTCRLTKLNIERACFSREVRLEISNSSELCKNSNPSKIARLLLSLVACETSITFVDKNNMPNAFYPFTSQASLVSSVSPKGAFHSSISNQQVPSRPSRQWVAHSFEPIALKCGVIQNVREYSAILSPEFNWKPPDYRLYEVTQQDSNSELDEPDFSEFNPSVKFHEDYARQKELFLDKFVSVDEIVLWKWNAYWKM
jgi:hypothetical protein